MGRDEVIKQLTNLTYIAPKTLNFVSVLFDKPKEEFRCYPKKPLIKEHWNS